MGLLHAPAFLFLMNLRHLRPKLLKETPDSMPSSKLIKPALKTVKTVVDESQSSLESPERAVREGETLLRLEVLMGPMDGFTHFSTKGEVVLGRGPSADMVLELDSRVSSRHARVFLDKGLIWLEDLGSTNGTFLGTEELAGKIPLAPGVQFTVGRTLLEILPERGGD